MCTRYPIINRVSELKVHIELTRFVQPEKIEIDANERAVNEKSQYCFFVCTTFDSFLNDLLKLFSGRQFSEFFTYPGLEKIQNRNSVCISVKVEHNVGSSMYDVCSMEYWESAIEYITRTVENPLFFICSDNVEYVLRNLIDATKYDYVVQDKNVPVYVSLAVMSECKHFIIGNTTFGWWAQYMSQNPNKIVVAPSKWMAVDMPIDLYENNWHLIEV